MLLRRLRLEDLPKAVLAVPLVVQWLALALRYRSLTLPSCLNPSIETGGLAGESKSACLAQIGQAFGAHVAAWQKIGPGEDAVGWQRRRGFGYPVIAKPDIGWCGYGVRRIEDEAGLEAYAARFPRNGAFLLQRFVPAAQEAGLFYVREPGVAAGRLVAIALRHAPAVVGDGRRSVAALLAAQPRLARRQQAVVGPAAAARIPAPGERVPLTTVASLRVGARYEDGSAHITPALNGIVDAIARSMTDFHVGRFDVRFETLADLQEGRFTIIEVNGAGSEAIHLWDPSLSLDTAFAGVFAKQRLLFRLGDRMRRLGHQPVGPLGLARAWVRQQRLIRRYGPSN